MLKSLLDYRYIYLFRLIGTNDCKLGISHDAEDRNSRVDKAVTQGKVKIIFKVKVLFAEWVEDRIGDLFSCSNFTMQNVGRAAGKTEWYDLNIVERFVVKCWMVWYGVWPYLLLIFLLASAGMIYVFGYK